MPSRSAAAPSLSASASLRPMLAPSRSAAAPSDAAASLSHAAGSLSVLAATPYTSYGMPSVTAPSDSAAHAVSHPVAPAATASAPPKPATASPPGVVTDQSRHSRLVSTKPPLHPSKRLRVDNAQGAPRLSPTLDRAVSAAQGSARTGPALERALSEDSGRVVAGAHGLIRQGPEGSLRQNPEGSSRLSPVLDSKGPDANTRAPSDALDPTKQRPDLAHLPTEQAKPETSTTDDHDAGAMQCPEGQDTQQPCDLSKEQPLRGSANEPIPAGTASEDMNSSRVAHEPMPVSMTPPGLGNSQAADEPMAVSVTGLVLGDKRDASSSLSLLGCDADGDHQQAGELPQA